MTSGCLVWCIDSCDRAEEFRRKGSTAGPGRISPLERDICSIELTTAGQSNEQTGKGLPFEGLIAIQWPVWPGLLIIALLCTKSIYTTDHRAGEHSIDCARARSSPCECIHSNGCSNWNIKHKLTFKMSPFYYSTTLRYHKQWFNGDLQNDKKGFTEFVCTRRNENKDAFEIKERNIRWLCAYFTITIFRTESGVFSRFYLKVLVNIALILRCRIVSQFPVLLMFSKQLRRSPRTQQPLDVVCSIEVAAEVPAFDMAGR